MRTIRNISSIYSCSDFVLWFSYLIQYNTDIPMKATLCKTLLLLHNPFDVLIHYSNVVLLQVTLSR